MVIGRNTLLNSAVCLLTFLSNGQAEFVDPFIGTGGHGHTFPGPCLPFGMVQLSPDTRLTGWDGCSGYHFTDDVIYGFSHTHLSGTGVSDYGDILVMPAKAADVDTPESKFDKSREKAGAGYYTVYLNKPKVQVDLTTTLRVGLHTYTFDEASEYALVVDLDHRDKVLNSSFEVISENVVNGSRISEGWAREQHVYFYLESSKQFTRVDSIKGTRKYLLYYNLSSGEQLKVKVGISAVDTMGARLNVQTESDGWAFEKNKVEAFDIWNQQLSKIRVTSKDKTELTKFYTALYHSMIVPNLYTDVDGRFRGTDLKIHKTDLGNPQYTIFSLWDTFRATHPLYTLVEPTRTSHFIQTFMRHYRDGGKLPVWELAANYTGCMIGYHSVSVIADAVTKDLIGRTFLPKLLEASMKSSNADELGIPSYKKYGYIPSDKEHESVSKTLEYAYDDWCIAQIAMLAGSDSVYQSYLQRSQYYKNLLHPETGYMTPKINGDWKKNFDPTEVNFSYTEANGWQYSYFAPHDISGMIKIHGGESNFESHLDRMFNAPPETSGRKQVDITGLIGQYAHGNEPSHHVAFLYHYVGKPEKTQKWINLICDSLYTTSPDGLSGNEDCGQMSSWYVMAACGLYQICPGKPEYVLFKPRFKEISIQNEHGKLIEIVTKGNGQFVDYIELDGKRTMRSYVRHTDLLKHKRITVHTSDDPTNWGKLDENRPNTEVMSTKEFVVNPTINHDNPSFTKKMKVTLSHPNSNAKIYYSLNGEDPSTTSSVYSKPIKVKQSTLIKAIAVVNGGSSKVEYCSLVKREMDYSITYKTRYDNQYAGGGDEGLIDGLRGGDDFRTERWQGFYGEDVVFTLDLGATKDVSKVTTGLLQDIRSWIWFPTSIEILASTNGEDFKSVSTKEVFEHKDEYGSFTLDAVLDFKKTNARYVKVILKNPGVNPEWHLGAGKPTWIFIDEVIVE